jgi:HEAT repeat protein
MNHTAFAYRIVAMIGFAAVNAHAACLLAAPDNYEKSLRGHGLRTDDASLRSYLKRVASADQQSTQALLDKLGHEKFSQREAATRQLARLLEVSPQRLDQATRSPHSQVVLRARWIAAQRQREGARPDQILYAVLRLVEQRRLEDAVPLLLDVARLCSANYLRNAHRDALQAAVQDGDRTLLREAIASGELPRRRAAMVALVVLDPKAAASDLKRLFKDKDNQVRLAAAIEIAKLGDRDAIAELVSLLQSEKETVRAESIRLLRRMTGKNFGYVSISKPADRAAATKRWNKWLDEHGATAKLRPAEETVRFVACVEAKAIVGLDSKGKSVWRFEKIPGWRYDRISSPSGVQRLPNGNWLITSHSMPWLFEIDVEGRLVRARRLPWPAGSLQRLDNGNLLMCQGSKRKIIEMTPDGGTHWEASVKGLAGDALRLPNGNTLVSVHNLDKLLELNPKGERVRVFEDLSAPASVRRLVTGNLLMAHYDGKIAEYTPDGRTVWTLKGFASPRDVIALENGNLLVADKEGVREITRRSVLVWQAKLGQVERLYRIP